MRLDLSIGSDPLFVNANSDAVDSVDNLLLPLPLRPLLLTPLLLRRHSRSRSLCSDEFRRFFLRA